MLKTFKQAGCEDFHEVLACIGEMERSGMITQVVDDSGLSAKIRATIMVHNDLQVAAAILDQENPNNSRQ